jgi:dTDP-4-amino-4,6-dideoxygalactose transaminase
MVPRTKVNYGFKNLTKAFFITEKKSNYKDKLILLLKDFLKQQNVLLTPSGRGGLYYLLKAIDRNKVIVPAYTCKVVVEAAILAGKEVAFVEIEKDGFNIDILNLKEVVDEDSIVIATHQFGIPCKIKDIAEICKQKKALLIEDVAAGFGSKANGKLVGSFSDAAFYSFDSSKLINVPMKGGFVTVKNPILFNKLCSVYLKEVYCMPWMHKVHLLFRGFILVVIENNFLYSLFYRLFFSLRNIFTLESPVLNLKRGEFYRYDFTNWQAYFALSQLKRINEIVEIRQEIYNKYISELKDCKEFKLPLRDNKKEWACIRFPIRVKGDKVAFYKQAVKRGVDFAFSFTFIAAPDSFKRAKRLADSVLDLPFYLKLRKREFLKVVSTLKTIDAEFLNENKKNN